MDVGPVTSGEHSLKLGVHVEVSDDTCVLLAKQVAELGHQPWVWLEECRLRLGERALRKQGVGRNA